MLPNIKDYDMDDLRQFMLYVTDSKIAKLRALIDFTEEQITNAGNAKLVEMNNYDWINISEDELRKRTRIDEFEFYKIETIYSRLSAQSIFLTAYGFLETSMNNLCIAYQNKTKANLTFSDFKNGRGIERAAKYLKQVASLSKINDMKIWYTIKNWADVRNCLIHNDGIPNTKNDILKRIQSLGLKIDDLSDRIIIELDDCREFVDTMDTYLQFIHKLEPDKKYI